MKRLAPSVVLVALGGALAGCAASGKHLPTVSPSASYPGRPSSPHVLAIGRVALAGVDLRNGASLVSPTRLAIVTARSGSCPAVPNRLVVENPNTIRVHLTMRVVVPMPRRTICPGSSPGWPCAVVSDSRDGGLATCAANATSGEETLAGVVPA